MKLHLDSEESRYKTPPWFEINLWKSRFSLEDNRYELYYLFA